MPITEKHWDATGLIESWLGGKTTIYSCTDDATGIEGRGNTPHAARLDMQLKLKQHYAEKKKRY